MSLSLDASFLFAKSPPRDLQVAVYKYGLLKLNTAKSSKCVLLQTVFLLMRNCTHALVWNKADGFPELSESDLALTITALKYENKLGAGMIKE